jgi:hypothetical protein
MTNCASGISISKRHLAWVRMACSSRFVLTCIFFYCALGCPPTWQSSCFMLFLRFFESSTASDGRQMFVWSVWSCNSIEHDKKIKLSPSGYQYHDTRERIHQGGNPLMVKLVKLHWVWNILKSVETKGEGPDPLRGSDRHAEARRTWQLEMEMVGQPGPGQLPITI